MDTSVENTNFNAAGTTMESIADHDDGGQPEFMVLADNGELVPAETVEQQTPPHAAEKAKPGDDGQNQQPFKSQHDINAAIAARLERERNKFQPDVEFASKVRTLFSGMTDEQIDDLLLDAAASDTASKKNIPVEVAREIASLRVSRSTPKAEPVVKQETASAPSPDARIQELASEAEMIESITGVNMAEVLKSNPELNLRVFSEGASLSEAYKIYAEQNRTAQPSVRPVAPVRKPNGAGSPDTLGGMSKERLEQMWNKTKDGYRIKLE